MKNHEDNRRPEEIEHDIERTRAQLSSNIDAIQSRLTPGEMMDEAISYARTSLPADFGSNLNKAVRENPIPVALIGLGVAWLAMQGKQRPGYMDNGHKSFGFRGDSHRPGSGFASEHGLGFGGQGDVDDHGVGGHVTGDHSSSFDNAKHRASAAGSNLKDKASATGSNLKDKASAMAQNVKSRFSGSSDDSSEYHSSGSSGPGIKEKMSSAGQSIREKASSIGQRFSESGSDMGERSRGMAQSARSRASDLGQRSQQQYYRARDNVSHMVEEQPMMLGALGLAVGTLIGALMPPTRREDELMGHTRDDLFARGQQMAREKADDLKASAQHVAETAKETAKQEAQRMGSDSSGRGRDGDSYQKDENPSGASAGSQSLH